MAGPPKAGPGFTNLAIIHRRVCNSANSASCDPIRTVRWPLESLLIASWLERPDAIIFWEAARRQHAYGLLRAQSMLCQLVHHKQHAHVNINAVRFQQAREMMAAAVVPTHHPKTNTSTHCPKLFWSICKPRRRQRHSSPILVSTNP